eukprot:GHRQ01032646.1.p2 GENE.GHRQ01032646.1~~GHRQ01032646.1.p2  ORF type:complete len:115 (-),score=37.92 GHRQ01032646.1:195-539(-)
MTRPLMWAVLLCIAAVVSINQSCPRAVCCRYAGTDVAVMTRWQEGSDPAAAFAAAYQREFGFVLERGVVVDDLRVRATGRAAKLPEVAVSAAQCRHICCECSAGTSAVLLFSGG